MKWGTSSHTPSMRSGWLPPMDLAVRSALGFCSWQRRTVSVLHATQPNVLYTAESLMSLVFPKLINRPSVFLWHLVTILFCRARVVKCSRKKDNVGVGGLEGWRAGCTDVAPFHPSGYLEVPCERKLVSLSSATKCYRALCSGGIPAGRRPELGPGIMRMLRAPWYLPLEIGFLVLLFALDRQPSEHRSRIYSQWFCI